jgi:hypothetical protein
VPTEINFATNKTTVAIFAFNRPNHLLNCLNSIIKNPQSDKFDFVIFVDGPRNSDDAKYINESIQVAKNFAKYLNINVIANEVNLGLSKSLVSGINKVFNSADQIIVIEDDLIVGRNFLDFMMNGLERYRDDIQVASIHGFTYDFLKQDESSYFLQGADCWGWATWKDRWESVEWDSKKLLEDLRNLNLLRSFDLEGAYPYSRLLERQMLGKVDSWAIRWHASMFIQGRFTLYPSKSLVENTGFDGSGTHTKQSLEVRDYKIDEVKISEFPKTIEENPIVLKQLKYFLRRKFHTYKRWSFKWLYWGFKRKLKRGTN